MFNNGIKKFPSTIFAIASIIILIIFMMIFFVVSKEAEYLQKEDQRAGQNNSRFYLNEDYEHKDPYTTKIPKLRDMLKGPIISDLDPSKGDINSDLSMVIFADFECSYYKKGEAVLKKLMDEYDLRLVWKDYPLNDPKSRSYRASIAARCAQLEGAFWDYHDLLFSGEYKYDRDGFLQIAEELNLDTEEFASCFDNKKTNQLVYDNMLEADALGIDGVPFIYINDQQSQGDIDEKLLRKLIEVELEDK